MAKMISRPICLPIKSIKSLYISKFSSGKIALLVGIAEAIWQMLAFVASNMVDLSGVKLSQHLKN